jgi:hypothetical protein
MSGVLVISDDDRQRIAEMIRRAREHPIPLETLMAGAINPSKVNVQLADRKPGFERPPSDHMMLGTYRVAFSFECQPVGLVRHLSVSSASIDKVPAPVVVEMIANEFGFGHGPRKFWMEEFDPGHYAVNVIDIAEPNQSYSEATQ